jgi:hypothetical protein
MTLRVPSMLTARTVSTRLCLVWTSEALWKTEVWPASAASTAAVGDVAGDEVHVVAPLVDAVVEDGDAVAAADEGVDEVAAEEAAAPGDERGAGGVHGGGA